jgi:hypothetical protein
MRQFIPLFSSCAVLFVLCFAPTATANQNCVPASNNLEICEGNYVHFIKDGRHRAGFVLEAFSNGRLHVRYMAVTSYGATVSYKEWVDVKDASPAVGSDNDIRAGDCVAFETGASKMQVSGKVVHVFANGMLQIEDSEDLSKLWTDVTKAGKKVSCTRGRT